MTEKMGMAPQYALARAADMASNAGQLEAVTTELADQVGDLREQHDWQGVDAERFFGEFDDFLAQMRRAVARLRTGSVDLHERAVAQIRTSTAG